MMQEAPLPSDTRSPIFIGGQRRSGTSLFRVLLNRHPHIACGPESKFIQHPDLMRWHNQLTDEWSERTERYGFGPEAVDRALAALVDNLFTRYQLRQGKQRWAEKTPTNILRIDYIYRLFPRAQFVHIIRDPRDVFCSIRDRTKRDRPEWAKFTASRSAKDWRKAIRAGQPWRDSPDRYLEIHYEDLVCEPEATLRRVLDFVHEPWDDAVLDPGAGNEEARGDPQVRSGAFLRSSIGRWKHELSPEEVADIERGSLKLMAEFGYETVIGRSDGADATFSRSDTTAHSS